MPNFDSILSGNQDVFSSQFGDNPWSGATQEAANNVNQAYGSQQSQGQFMFNNMGNQLSQYAQNMQQGASYPTFENNFGIGSGVPFGSQNQQNNNQNIEQKYGSPYELFGQARTR